MNSMRTMKKIKQIIVDKLRKLNPENSKQPVEGFAATANGSKVNAGDVWPRLLAEGKPGFNGKKLYFQDSTVGFVFSRRSLWYWITMLLAVLGAVSTGFPTDVYPLGFLRAVLGLNLVLFLPGFAFIRAVWPKRVSWETNSRDLDLIVRLALSVGSSLVITPLVGLAFYYSPWGVETLAVTTGLVLVTVAFSIIGMLREYNRGIVDLKVEPI